MPVKVRSAKPSATQPSINESHTVEAAASNDCSKVLADALAHAGEVCHTDGLVKSRSRSRHC